MTMLERLELWKGEGRISPSQQAQFESMVREEPFSLSLEINVLLYAGVLAFVAGLGWTISTWSKQIGDVAIVGLLTLMVGAAFWYCFSRVAAWSPGEVPSPTPVFDYVLYFGCLVWGAELGYVEARFHLLSGQWDLYLLASAVLFFLFAYRFDNRFVLSLAMSSLAGWFGFTVSRWPATFENGDYRHYALLYCVAVGAIGVVTRRLRVKPHFFGTYLNVVTNILFWTILSGVFDDPSRGLWELFLLAACAAALAWGLQRREFVFVAYAAVYGYIGLSSIVVRNIRDDGFILLYFVFTAAATIFGLVLIAREFGREA